MAYWDRENPWRDRLVYVPLEEIAECVAGGFTRRVDGSDALYTVDFVLSNWKQYGDRLDGYILPGADGQLHIGVRYGPQGYEYLSPRLADYDKALDLLTKYEETVTPKF